MGKKKRGGHPDIEEILGRPWCYYCERDFEDLKLLISHQKAKHFKCDRCGRRLNTAGGLSVHLNQVHKETLEQVENALPNRQGLDVEIFGMEGVPAEVLESHRSRLIQNFYQAQEDRRLATGNPLPGQSQNTRKKITIETAEELKARLAEWREKRKNGGAMEDVVATTTASHPGFAQQPFGDNIPTRPPPGVPFGLPQRPGDGLAPQADDIDNLIRMAEARAAADAGDAAAKASKKDKEKKGRMIYDDADTSPEERIAALPRYAYAALAA
ncbi:unnamed protein product [Clonostachys rhizophaga]|uniref:BUB3-interacting and GLEBS motif-containing protein ZNF207 n=1 Tax=Clonostachys rhizophaga TaxID=160324 RepID=A0A9N9VQ02_9HYPO|nr:unnamed protein product [Clonostachys rhizophaga]